MVVLTFLMDVGDQLVRAQLHHDRRQNEERASALLANRNPGPKVDYLVPIIADGDTGHGGLSAVMKLVKLFVEVRVYVFGVVHDTHYSLPNATNCPIRLEPPECTLKTKSQARKSVAIWEEKSWYLHKNTLIV